MAPFSMTEPSKQTEHSRSSEMLQQRAFQRYETSGQSTGNVGEWEVWSGPVNRDEKHECLKLKAAWILL